MKKLYFGTCLFALFLSHEVSAADVYVRQIAVKGLERVEPETVASYLDHKRAERKSGKTRQLAETAVCHGSV